MLFDNDLDVYVIQDYLATSLKNDTDFITACNTLLGKQLNYVTDAPFNDIDLLPELPYCSLHGGDENQDLRIDAWGHTYEIVLVFGIEDTTSSKNQTPPSSTVDGIVKYTSSRLIEQLAKEALKSIKGKMSLSGINGDYDIMLISANGVKTPTGEASDMNYILTLTFGYLDDINKGC